MYTLTQGNGKLFIIGFPKEERWSWFLAMDSGHGKLNSWKGEFIMTNTKKKNKNKAKLLSAVGMLTVSAAMLVSSTFAWFSMNKDVNVATLSLTAKSNQTYLLISKTHTTAADIQTEGSTTASESITGTDAQVYPSSPALTTTEAGYLSVAAGHYQVDGSTLISTAGVQVTDADKAADTNNWFTANATAVDAATINSTSAKQLTSFDGYVIHKTYYLTVAAGSNPANNLGVTATITQTGAGADAQAIKLLVTTDDGGFANLYTAGNDGTAHAANLTADIKGTNTNITNSTVRQVDVYLYYDGDEAPVYTNNAANLTGADVDLTFNVDPVET